MTLSQAYRECLPIIDRMKAEGVSFLDRIKGLDLILRQFWPFTREWHYLCAQCSDYGLVISECAGDATCGRKRVHLRHEFGTPCWCEKGARFRAKERTEATAVEAAARVKKPTRFGRN